VFWDFFLLSRKRKNRKPYLFTRPLMIAKKRELKIIVERILPCFYTLLKYPNFQSQWWQKLMKHKTSDTPASHNGLNFNS